MRLACQKGLTLVELIITVSIMAIIVGAAMPLVSSSLDAHNNGMARSRLYHEGMLAIELKRDAPIPAHAHGPGLPPLPLELMEVQTR